MRRLGYVLGDAVGRDEVLRAARAQAVLRRWDLIVGAPMARRSKPDRYDHGTVWVAVEGSAWAQELRMIKDLILQRLAEQSGDTTLFRDVRFGSRPLGGIEQAGETEAEPEAFPRPPEELSIREIAEQRLKDWPGAKRS